MGYYRPAGLAESLELLASHELTIIAGATDIYPASSNRRAWGDWRTSSYLDITGLGELRGISHSHDHYRIGALTTWTDLVRESLPGCFDALQKAALEIGGMQIQNRATIVGNICNASPAADGVPPLLCLDTNVELSSKTSTRILPLSEFLQGNRQTAITPDELVTALLIPRLSSDATSAFLKLGARRYQVISIVMAAGILELDDGGCVADMRMAVGACSPVAQRLSQLEADLRGGRAGPDLVKMVTPDHISGFTPIDDIRSDANYRRQSALEITRRLLLDLIGNAGVKHEYRHP